MATYGGELSLQRFLALEARAVPFDAAHAIGNAGLALVAGPAMVRMLIRFRERFEWRAPAVAATLLLALALASAMPARAGAADAGPQRAASWLAAQQSSDGGWGASPGEESSLEVTAWAMLGLESTGRSPLGVTRAGHDPVDYLRAHAGELKSPGALARTILALEGAEVDPRSFGGRNLVAALLDRRRGDGSFEGWPGSTAFAVIALRAAGATGGLGESTSWLAKAQNGDGGWGDTPGSPSTADGTGAVLQALPETEAAQRGLAYLRKHQLSSGGFALGGAGAVNSQSTAWALQGLLAVGGAAELRTGALEFLAARQAGDGHYRYSASSDQTPVFVTAEAIPATAGEAFPVAPVGPPAPTPPPAPATGESAPVPTLPPAPGGAGTSQELLESLRRNGNGASSGGGSSAGKPSTGSPRSGNAPAAPPAVPETQPSASPPPAVPAFEASDASAPSPWPPIGVGLGASAAALASVLLLGRRFGW